MAAGIMIMGPSGSGKTTLGKMVADKLGFAFVDVDEYIWRKDSEIPFTEMYTRKERISRLMEAINCCEHFVMAGSIYSFHEYFDPFFELVVHLQADAQLRVKRVHGRELGIYGKRLLPGGDMFEEHQKFLEDITGYDYGAGGCTLQEHETWLSTLKCKVLKLDGAQSLVENGNIIINEYRNVCAGLI